MIARVIAALRRWRLRAVFGPEQHQLLHQARERQRAILARAEALGVHVDVQTRRYRKEHGHVRQR